MGHSSYTQALNEKCEGTFLLEKLKCSASGSMQEFYRVWQQFLDYIKLVFLARYTETLDYDLICDLCIIFPYCFLIPLFHNYCLYFLYIFWM